MFFFVKRAFDTYKLYHLLQTKNAEINSWINLNKTTFPFRKSITQFFGYFLFAPV